MDLSEARRGLDQVMGDDLRQQYFGCLRQWYLFASSYTVEHLNVSVRKVLTTEEQYKCHLDFILALNLKKSTILNNGGFEMAYFTDYIDEDYSSNNRYQNEYRLASAELFTPDSEFINCRIEVSAWENELIGAEPGVSEIIAYACKVFLKNIITAMLTRAKGYKIRDGKFQYGFNTPIPDPYIRNYKNIVDESLENKVELDEDVFLPKSKRSLERAEQEVAYAYASSKKIKTGVTLSRRLLFETLQEEPQVLGLHSLQSVSLLKLGLGCDNNEEDSSENEYDK